MIFLDPKLDFVFSKHFVLDAEAGLQEFSFTEYYIIELSKFTKNINELVSIVEKWIYLLKNAASFQKVPVLFENTNLEKACTVLAESNWNSDQLEAYDRYLHGKRSIEGQIDTAWNEGKLEGKFEIARIMLNKGMDVDIISEYTGLGSEEIKKIKMR